MYCRTKGKRKKRGSECEKDVQLQLEGCLLSNTRMREIKRRVKEGEKVNTSTREASDGRSEGRRFVPFRLSPVDEAISLQLPNNSIHFFPASFLRAHRRSLINGGRKLTEYTVRIGCLGGRTHSNQPPKIFFFFHFRY